MSEEKLNWHGQSGTAYEYVIPAADWRPASGQEGNYTFARLVNYVWYAIYVGQGDLQSRYDAAIREGCVSKKGATHYHAHLNKDEDTRLAEETDIIKGNLECLWPRGCNGNDQAVFLSILPTNNQNADQHSNSILRLTTQSTRTSLQGLPVTKFDSCSTTHKHCGIYALAGESHSTSEIPFRHLPLLATTREGFETFWWTHVSR